MASKTTPPSSLLTLFLILNLLPTNLATSCPHPTPKPKGKCPVDALKLGVCAVVLDGLLNATIGNPPKKPCCTLIESLLDLEAAACLCTAIKANLLGLHLNIPLALSLLLNYCGKKVPTCFQCP
ncbi:Bifunctional inhibitor/lipid-transfer protein/seed storage 2S albumin protein [Dioscorea alata]|uniref:Bifunctional inhibitor/lipid-transfer protein/seed storage 2S albumin protein n=1 Tax=Dioscorea alata TaxID=55571 RepID=A0ACB7V683_DIOAL|nr:Bifunctional inhibitor/lipid-transfer protein/seed storage 2S albumin protein [Dioscorea alata]